MRYINAIPLPLSNSSQSLKFDFAPIWLRVGSTFGERQTSKQNTRAPVRPRGCVRDAKGAPCHWPCVSPLQIYGCQFPPPPFPLTIILNYLANRPHLKPHFVKIAILSEELRKCKNMVIENVCKVLHSPSILDKQGRLFCLFFCPRIFPSI